MAKVPNNSGGIHVGCWETEPEQECLETLTRCFLAFRAVPIRNKWRGFDLASAGRLRFHLWSDLYSRSKKEVLPLHRHQCEARRVQESTKSGHKTSFLLRMVEIQSRKRWTGNYYFYRDEDCTEPTYALEMEGSLSTKGHRITFNFTTVKVAVYRPELDNSRQTSYNRSCPGTMKSERKIRDTRIYSVDKNIHRQSQCLKALGLDLDEFTGAYFQSHSVQNKKVVELLQNIVDLRKGSGKGRATRNEHKSKQWPLRRDDTPRCLTCRMVAFAKLIRPPKLNARNSSVVNGMWGSSRCRVLSRSVYMSRIDRFGGKSFETFMFLRIGMASCKEPNIELHTTGALRKVSDSLEVPGGVVYEMAVKTAFLTVNTVGMARILNRNPGRCGKETWEKGKKQDLLPTNGCLTIGYAIGSAELVLIRTVHDENRHELYFGAFTSVGRISKSGPSEYNFISQDCSKFPVIFATPTPTTEATEVFDELPKRTQIVRTEEEILATMKAIEPNKKARSGAKLYGGFPELILLCFVLLCKL